MCGYCREVLHFNHFWELKGQFAWNETISLSMALNSFPCIYLFCLFIHWIDVRKESFFQSLLISGPSLNHLTPKSDWHLISPYNIIPESHIEVTRKKGNDHQIKKLLIVKQSIYVGPRREYPY